MNKNELLEIVKAMIAAPSCCEELQAAGKNWLNAIGTPGEKAAAEALLAEIKDDVAPIAHTVEFFESPLAVQIFGAEKAKIMAAHAREIQSKGAKWCDCPACAAGVKILENASVLTA